MKKIILLTILACIFATGAWAQTLDTKTSKMQENIYGGTIDAKAAFYQKRIYLADSKSPILAEIGQDAIEKVSFYKAYRQQLIKDMAAENIKLKRSSLNAFLLSKTNNLSTSMEAYSQE